MKYKYVVLFLDRDGCICSGHHTYNYIILQCFHWGLTIS